MPYLSIDDLSTHLNPEIILEIVRDNVKEYANLAAFPITGIKRYNYKALDTSKYYIWDGDSYIERVFVDKVRKAINTGLGEAKSYLNRYDHELMFSDDDSKRTYKDDMLDGKVKDLVIWHLVRLGNPNSNLEIIRTSYEDAIKYFDKVMKGLIDPANWPLKANNPATPNDEAGNVEYRSLTKRINHF